MLIVEDKALQSQVERILHSDEFRTSEVLRRLFKFLAEKTVAGEADHLKEYAVAIDGLGKHPS
jgi:predicted component of type VI protein secretion system